MVLLEGIYKKARFINRLNRFVATVQIEKEIFNVHVPNSGRLKELLIPGAQVILRKANNPSRKYMYDLIMVYKNDILVCVDSLLPNRLLYDAILKKHKLLKSNRKTRELLEYEEVNREVSFKNSRFDIGLKIKDKLKYLIEIKGVTLVKNNCAYFPDAPTLRGKKHLKELIVAKQEGFGAGIFFIIQRKDVSCFAPNFKMDKSFSAALKEAVSCGVDIFAIRCDVCPLYIKLKDFVPVKL